MATQNNNETLLKPLDQALQLANQFSGGYSGEFLSAEEFCESLSKSINNLEQGDLSQFEKLRIWFLPTSCWDDFTGERGQILGNQICTLLDRKSTQDVDDS